MIVCFLYFFYTTLSNQLRKDKCDGAARQGGGAARHGVARQGDKTRKAGYERIVYVLVLLPYFSRLR